MRDGGLPAEGDLRHLGQRGGRFGFAVYRVQSGLPVQVESQRRNSLWSACALKPERLTTAARTGKYRRESALVRAVRPARIPACPHLGSRKT